MNFNAVVRLSSNRTDEFPLHVTNTKLLAKAIKNVRAMDKHDGHTVADTPVDLALRTIMSAVSCGIDTEDWNCVADALVMLQQLEHGVRLHVMPDEGAAQ